jgi:hypothetical protein
MSNENILGLPPIGPGYGFGANSVGLIPEGKSLPRGEIQEINQDSIRRRVAIDTLAVNNEKAVDLILKLDQKAYAAFYKSTQNIVEMMMEAQGKPYEKYCMAFGERIIQVTAHHTSGLSEAAAARIAYEVNRPSESEEEPKGFWKKLTR